MRAHSGPLFLTPPADTLRAAPHCSPRPILPCTLSACTQLNTPKITRIHNITTNSTPMQTTFPDLPNLPLAPPTYVEGVNEAAVAEMHAAAKQLQAALYELEVR